MDCGLWTVDAWTNGPGSTAPVRLFSVCRTAVTIRASVYGFDRGVLIKYERGIMKLMIF